jgi:hypothetical protein
LLAWQDFVAQQTKYEAIVITLARPFPFHQPTLIVLPWICGSTEYRESKLAPFLTKLTPVFKHLVDAKSQVEISHGADAVFAQPGLPNRHATRGMTIKRFNRQMFVDVWQMFQAIASDEKWKWSNVMFELHHLETLEQTSNGSGGDNAWPHRYMHAYALIDMV